MPICRYIIVYIYFIKSTYMRNETLEHSYTNIVALMHACIAPHPSSTPQGGCKHTQHIACAPATVNIRDWRRHHRRGHRRRSHLCLYVRSSVRPSVHPFIRSSVSGMMTDARAMRLTAAGRWMRNNALDVRTVCVCLRVCLCTDGMTHLLCAHVERGHQ